MSPIVKYFSEESVESVLFVKVGVIASAIAPFINIDYLLNIEKI